MTDRLPILPLLDTFPALALQGIAHGLVRRVPGIAVDLEKSTVLARLKPWHDAAVTTLGFDLPNLCTAEQIHGAETAVLTASAPRHTSGVDGLMTDVPGLVLAIHTADCAPIFLLDPIRRAIALLHSGRKGTEAGITPRAIELMGKTYGSQPADLILQIGPCIRPPLFEIDLPALIIRHAIAAGLPAAQIHDCHTCTGASVERYYTYRVEKGKTGRLVSLLGLT